jgi:hypothetical protein
MPTNPVSPRRHAVFVVFSSIRFVMDRMSERAKGNKRGDNLKLDETNAAIQWLEEMFALYTALAFPEVRASRDGDAQRIPGSGDAQCIPGSLSWDKLEWLKQRFDGMHTSISSTGHTSRCVHPEVERCIDFLEGQYLVYRVASRGDETFRKLGAPGCSKCRSAGCNKCLTTLNLVVVKGTPLPL